MRSAYNSLSLALCGLIKSIRFSGYSHRIIPPLLANNAFKIDTEIILPNPRNNVFIASKKAGDLRECVQFKAYIHSVCYWCVAQFHLEQLENIEEFIVYHTDIACSSATGIPLAYEKMLHSQRQRYIRIM